VTEPPCCCPCVLCSCENLSTGNWRILADAAGGGPFSWPTN
jgi:hypothetical protein